MVYQSNVLAYRTLFPITRELAHLNNAGVGATSTRVVEAVRDYLEGYLARSSRSGGGGPGDAWESAVEETRLLAARLIGAGAHEIALVRNTSHGLGLLAEGLDWKPGDEVILCRAVEYPSNVYMWERLSERGVVVRNLEPIRGGVSAQAVEQVIGPRTRVVTVSSVQYATGHRTDLAALGALCRDTGALLCVDGIQSLGLEPLRVKELGVHLISACSHKWMLGLLGVGFAFIDEALVGRLRPPYVGWKSMREAWSFDVPRFELRPDAAGLEEGTPAYALVYGLRAALALIFEVGQEHIHAQALEQCRALDAGLTALGFEVGPGLADRSGIITVTHPRLAAADLAGALERGRVIAAVRRGQLRLSAHYYNDASDVAAVIDALRPLV